jgi:hypothetical protein
MALAVLSVVSSSLSLLRAVANVFLFKVSPLWLAAAREGYPLSHP